MALQKEIFGLTIGGFQVTRYDVTANTFYNCGPTMDPKFITNLAMDNNLINQQVHDTFAPGMNIIDGFTP